MNIQECFQNQTMPPGLTVYNKLFYSHNKQKIY